MGFTLKIRLEYTGAAIVLVIDGKPESYRLLGNPTRAVWSRCLSSICDREVELERIDADRLRVYRGDTIVGSIDQPLEYSLSGVECFVRAVAELVCGRQEVLLDSSEFEIDTNVL